MAGATTTLQQFQEFVYDQLPPRRDRLGREAVYDAVAVAVQEWPDKELSAAAAGSPEEALATGELVKSMRRHLEVAYGEERFGVMWVIALQALLPYIIEAMLRWWRKRKENKARIRIWRRKWVNDPED